METRDTDGERKFQVFDTQENELGVFEIGGTTCAIFIPYEWWLAGAAGAGFLLTPPNGTESAVVKAAKDHLRRTRDVVVIRVEEKTT